MCICVVGLIYAEHISRRNPKVYEFLTQVVDSGFSELKVKLKEIDTNWDDGRFKAAIEEYDRLSNKIYSLVTKYSYERLLYSLKPLEFEKWYTEEEIKLLGLYEDR